MIKPRHAARPAALLLLLAMLFTLLSTAVHAEDTEAPAAYAEPMLLRADDYTEVTGGFRLFADNPENLPLQLGYAVYSAQDPTTPLAIPDGWVAVTAIDPPAEDSENTDAAQTARPVFAVDFHKPGDINVEDPAYIESPEFLRAVSVTGSPVYTLAPGYIASFRITGGTADENGVYQVDHTVHYRNEMPMVTFALDRPAKLITRLSQNEGEHGRLDVSVLNSDVIRYLHNRLVDEKEAFLAEYGLSDAQLYIQYDQTRMDVPSSYDAEADDGLTEVWSPETLESCPKEFDLNLGFTYSHTHTFDDESFRAFFPEETFTEKTIDDGDDATEDPAFWVIDAETVALSVRARYVLALTAQDGTVYYQKSAFTDPFYCGASNSLVAEPTALESPVLSDPIFETAEDGSVTLTFHAASNTTVRDTSFWCQTYGKNPVRTDVEISVNGAEWQTYDLTADGISSPVIYEDGIWTLPVSADQLSEYAYIRIQMRYTADDLALQSPFSAALAFDIKPEEIVTAPQTEVTIPLYTEDTTGTGELKYVCPICGFCPAPYGVCLFLWIGAALLIVLLIVLIIALIPKKKYCPRCSAACRPQDKSCTTCGYRFVGNLPEIEDTTGDISLPDRMTEKEDAFFDEALRDGKTAPRVTPVNVFDDEPDMPAAPAAEPVKPAPAKATAPAQTAPAQTSALAKPDAAFLAELKRKMAQVKSGQRVSFTPAELAYIKQLKEKNAAAAAAKPAAAMPATQPAEPAPASDTREIPVVKPAAPAGETREEQIARLRALRAKQLSAEDAAAVNTAAETAAAKQQKAETQAPAEQLRRVEKPAKQIKCPACAVPNPETSGQCYICGTRLK